MCMLIVVSTFYTNACKAVELIALLFVMMK